LIDGDGVIVGIGAAGGAARPRAAKATIVVREDWGDSGAGALLLRGLGAAAGEAGLESLTITYATDNVVAERLVKSCGVLSAKRVVGETTTVVLLVGRPQVTSATKAAGEPARPLEAQSAGPT